MSDRAVILANGNVQDADILMARLQTWKGAIVIAADGGVRHAKRLSLDLSIVIGDLDSLEEGDRVALRAAIKETVKVAAAKDETDLELALLHAVEIGISNLAVIGAFGGRIDMSLSNILLLSHPDLLSTHIEYWQGRQTAWLIRPPGDEIRGRSGDTLSLIPLNGDAEGITTHGLLYPLKNEVLTSGPARGVSNVLTTPLARVVMGSGELIAVHTPGET